MRPAPAAALRLAAGPALFALVLLAWRSDAMGVVAGATAWMALWWMTEALPIPATSLLPLVLFPTFAGEAFPLADVAVNYGNPRVFLFLGGFLVAIAIERTGLHRRIALRLVARIGTGPRRLVLGFMVATAFLSMWISNTATALMMLPIGVAVAAQVRAPPRFATALMLSIAYGASIGGVGTLIGTPPNISFRGQLGVLFPDAPGLTFAQWMGLGVPFAAVFVPVAWWLLVRRLPRGAFTGRAVVAAEIARLGPRSTAERRVLVVFVATALLWVFRKPIDLGFVTLPGWLQALRLALPGAAVDDGVVAMAMGLLLFVLGDGKGARILDWEVVARRMPWGILLLFGGGFALADAIRASGLSAVVGQQFGFLAGAPPLLLMAGCAAGVTFLTEVTSNTATAEILLPLVAGIAVNAGTDPLVMMLPVTLAASCAFMLPVATPPNAVVFGSGHVRMRDMVRAGLAMNLVGIALVALVCYAAAGWIFGVDYDGGVPAWARP